MIVCIPSYGRSETISDFTLSDANRMLFSRAGLDVCVLVHNNREYRAYRRNPALGSVTIYVTDVEPGIFGNIHQKEWAYYNLFGKGDWFSFMDDDLKTIYALPQPWYEADTADFPTDHRDVIWYNRYWTPATYRHLGYIVNDMVRRAEDLGTVLCGFGHNNNFFFRGEHWKKVAFCRANFQIWKRVGYFPFPDIHIDDMVHTSYCLTRYGSVLVNNFVWPDFGPYYKGVGGLGVKEARRQTRQDSCDELMRMFPGLWRMKKGDYPDMQLAVNIRTFDRWRDGLRSPLCRSSPCHSPLYRSPIRAVKRRNV